MSKFSVLFGVLLLLPVALFSQEYIERGYRTIQALDARAIVEILASDSLQGRKAGEEGGLMAAEYITAMLGEWGVEPLGDQVIYQHTKIGSRN